MEIIEPKKVKELKQAGKFAVYVLIGFIVLVGIFGSFGTIGAGQRGVVLQFGAVQDKIFDEGL